jgi:hypothetical protein
MAWIFQLALEFGQKRCAAMKIVDGFGARENRLPDGLMYKLLAKVEDHDEEGNWWVSITPARSSGEFIDSRDSKALLGMLAKWLYAELLEVSGYRFGLVGIETYRFNTFTNISLLLQERHLHGFVLRSDYYLQWGKPPGFEPFTSEYMWIPFRESDLTY